MKLSEWQPFAATRRTSSAVSSCVPDGGDGHGDEPGRVGGAPLVQVPVVVGTDEGERQVEIVAQKGPGRERGEAREVHGGEHTARVHVLHPLVDVVTARPHLVEALRLEPVLLLGSPGDGVERGRLHDDLPEGPDVVPLVVTDELRRALLVLRGEVVHEEIGWLDDVIVDADQNEVVNLAHGSLLRTSLSVENNDPTMPIALRSGARPPPRCPKPPSSQRVGRPRARVATDLNPARRGGVENAALGARPWLLRVAQPDPLGADDSENCKCLR